VSLRKISAVEVEISLMKVEEQPFLKWTESRKMLIYVASIAIGEVWKNKIIIKV